MCDKDSTQRQAQSKHPKESQRSSQLQGQHLAEKVQQKLQHDAGSRAAPADADSALAASGQVHSDHQKDRRHHKGSHAHFADESASALNVAHEDVNGSFTGRDESFTAVRGGAAGVSNAQGSFWRDVDSDGGYRAMSGDMLH